MKKVLVKKFLAAGLVATAALGFTSCKKDAEDPKEYTYRTSTTVSPSNWNELTYQDNNDTQIMKYLKSSFFEFNYKFDSDGNVTDGYTVEYSAATALRDVTSTYAGNNKYNVPTTASKGYAYEITLRNDLKWNDGTAIKAEDFVYSMKEQLNPLFKNFRADSFYNGSTVIANAKGYAYQGSKGVYGGDTVYGTYSEDLDSKLVWQLGPKKDNQEGVGSFRSSFGLSAKYDLAATVAALANYGFDATVLTNMEGKTIAEIKADATMKAQLDKYVTWWEEGNDGILDVTVVDYTFPEVNFENVGIFASGDYKLVVVLDKALSLLNDDGSLSYKAAYNFDSLPLVKKDLYEANKVAPSGANALWTSTYNSSVSSSASWGPYTLTAFQAGKNYVLEKNPNWYGYSDSKYDGQYQTNKIECETLDSYNSQLMKFNAGEIDDIGIDSSVAADYKNSEQAIFTPDDFVQSLQLQSNAEALKNNQSAGINKYILSYSDFRKALSLSIDRAAYTATCTTSSKAGYGLFNSMHYYDVANGSTKADGGVYRNTIPAMKTLLDSYGVSYDASNEEDIKAKYKTVTGYDLDQAKKLFEKAYKEALANGDILATDKIVLKYGTSADTEAVQRMFKFFDNAFKEAVKGTSLEGKLSLEFDASYSTKWADEFRAGSYEICAGGWTGAAWDPGYFLLAYLSPDYMYSKAWDTSTETMTFTMPGKYIKETSTTIKGLEAGKDFTATMPLMDWYNLLNGEWGDGFMESDGRVLLIAALEKVILEKYYTVPVAYRFSASMISYKIEYKSRNYNTFMAYGGVRYMTYNYTDMEWNNYVKSQNGSINYKG